MGIRALSAFSCICVLLLCSSPPFCFSQSSAQTAPHAFSLEQVLSSPFPTNLVAAEHAGRMAWVFAAKGERNVWVADVDKGEPRLRGDMGCEEEGCEDIQISPSGEFAVWSAKKQLWIAPISGKTKADAKAKALFFVRGNNSQPKWSPDGKKIAFVSDRGDHSFVVIYEFGRNTLRYVSPSAC